MLVTLARPFTRFVDIKIFLSSHASLAQSFGGKFTRQRCCGAKKSKQTSPQSYSAPPSLSQMSFFAWVGMVKFLPFSESTESISRRLSRKNCCLIEAAFSTDESILADPEIARRGPRAASAEIYRGRFADWKTTQKFSAHVSAVNKDEEKDTEVITGWKSGDNEKIVTRHRFMLRTWAVLEKKKKSMKFAESWATETLY